MSIDNDKFQFVGEFYLKEYSTVRRGFFFVFSGATFGIRRFESFCRLNGSISKKLFLAFRGFDPYRRRDGFQPFRAKSRQRRVYHPQLVAVYHQHEVLYIIKPQVYAR